MLLKRHFISERRFDKKYLNNCKNFHMRNFCKDCKEVDIGVQEVEIKNILALSRNDLNATGRLDSAYRLIVNGWDKEKCSEINLLLTPSGKLRVYTDGNHRVYLAKTKLKFEKVWATINVKIPCKLLNEKDYKILEQIGNERNYILDEARRLYKKMESYPSFSDKYSHYYDESCKWYNFYDERLLREKNYMRDIVKREKLIPNDWTVELEKETTDEIDVIKI